MFNEKLENRVLEAFVVVRESRDAIIENIEPHMLTDLNAEQLEKMYAMNDKGLTITLSDFFIGEKDNELTLSEAFTVIVELYNKRRLETVINGAKGLIYQQEYSCNDVISTINDEFEQIIDETHSQVGVVDGKDAVAPFIDILKGKGKPTITCGIRALDHRVRISSGELITIGARPRVGKTAFALTMMNGQADEGIKTGLLCMEMTQARVMARLYSQRTGIPYQDLLKVRFDSPKQYQDELQKIGKISNDMIKFDFNMMCGRRLTPKGMIKLIKYWVKVKGVQVIYIDHLGLIKHEKANTRAEAIARTTNALIGICKELDCTIVLLCQIGRKGAGKMPALEDLKDAGSIEEDSDIVLLLDRPEVDRPNKDHGYGDKEGQQRDMKGKAAMIVAKDRNGESGSITIIDYNGPIMKFYKEPMEMARESNTY